MGKSVMVMLAALLCLTAVAAIAEEEARPRGGDAALGLPPRVPSGFRAAPESVAEPYSGTGWALVVVHEKTGMEMVFIPAGEFLMGLPSPASGRESEGPQHLVVISKPFYLGKYEVTQGEWQKVMGSNPSHFQGDLNPVERVSWNDCQKFIGKAGDGLRLSTEAEWEYGCRAGTTGPFHFGVKLSTDQANCRHDGNRFGRGSNEVYRQRTMAVGSFPANGWGLYDMHGNVREWCADWYDWNYYASSPREDPSGPQSGSYRVNRGGSWYDAAWRCSSANRRGYAPDARFYFLGFRLARTIP